MTHPPSEMQITRRTMVGGALAALATGPLALARPADEPWFRISLAEWSLHRTIHAGDLDPLDFAPHARRTWGFEAVEHVNGFFKNKVGDTAYFREMKTRADDAGVRSLLIMIDGEGALGAPDDAERRSAIDRHRRWLDVAKGLGCHSVRVNAHSRGTFAEQQRWTAEGLDVLAEYAARMAMNVLVENHGGYSSHGAWLAGVMRRVNRANCGTLPDFGNFRLGGGRTYDRYVGVRELMPFAKAVSAKSYGFDDETGDETTIDFRRMMQIVRGAGYRGWVGVEWEGGGVSETEGIRRTKALLERIQRD